MVDDELGTVPKSLTKGLGELDIRGGIKSLQTTSFVDVGKNTEKSPEHLWKLVATQTPLKHRQLTMVRKILEDAS